jgi:mannan endo-1,4-beta-mannosidase
MATLLSAAVASPALAASKPIHLEAENGRLSGGVVVDRSVRGYRGAGYVTGFHDKTSAVTMSFKSPGGLYELKIRYRTPSGPKGFDATIDGHTQSGMFPASTSFATASVGMVRLNAGANVVSVGGGWGWYDIDAVDFVLAKPMARPRPISAPPVDPKATPEARRLLRYLESVYGRATVSGQHDLNDFDYVVKTTGKTPAIASFDLIEYSSSRVAHGSHPQGTTEKAVAMGKSGNIVAVMWHWNAPTDLYDTGDNPWYKGFYTKATSFNVEYALDHPNSPQYRGLIADMDTIAGELAKLDQAHIPVLWRPLHEASGGWFWWGAHGPKPFVRLWRLMYHRFTNVHHLHNLLWVYTDGDPAWYPGDRYVDIVGTDQYPSDRSDLLTGVWADLKKRYDGRKLIALAEFKTVPEIDKMHAMGVWWDYFIPWTGDLGPKGMNAAELNRIFHAPGVITKDKLPKR